MENGSKGSDGHYGKKGIKELLKHRKCIKKRGIGIDKIIKARIARWASAKKKFIDFSRLDR